MMYDALLYISNDVCGLWHLTSHTTQLSILAMLMHVNNNYTSRPIFKTQRPAISGSNHENEYIITIIWPHPRRPSGFLIELLAK